MRALILVAGAALAVAACDRDGSDKVVIPADNDAIDNNVADNAVLNSDDVRYKNDCPAGESCP